jgi:NitT/TauT family transport system substrate-binding protein
MFGKNRSLRRAVLALLTGAMSVTLMMQAPGHGEAKELKKVKIGVATTFLGITYPWLMMPQALGYWKEEGYDVQVLPIGGSLQVIQQMVGGGVDIGQINASALIQSKDTNDIQMRAFMTNGVVDSAITVLSDSPIKDVKDLKGKKIGVFNLASGHIPFLKAYLSANNIDPDNGVQLIAVGFGASAVQALRSGQVDALDFWASANAIFENAGLSLRRIADPKWRSLPDFSMVAMQNQIDQHSDMLEAITRGAAKASLFAITNPDCVRRLQWKNWPETKPTGSGDEATLSKWDINSLEAQLGSMKSARDINPSKLWGQTSAEGYGRMQDFFKETGLVKKTIPNKDLVITDQAFFERANKFDHDAVVASAKACDIK